MRLPSQSARMEHSGLGAQDEVQTECGSKIQVFQGFSGLWSLTSRPNPLVHEIRGGEDVEGGSFGMARRGSGPNIRSSRTTSAPRFRTRQLSEAA